MHLNVVAQPDKIQLSFGPCQAHLSWEQAKILRQDLAKLLAKTWQLPTTYWVQQQQQLDTLEPLLPWLLEQDTALLEQLMLRLSTPAQLAVQRLSRNRHPQLARKLLQARHKVSPRLEVDQDAFADYLHSQPASSLTQVVAALQEVQTHLEELAPDLLATAQAELDLNTRYKLALNLFHQLEQLPTLQLQAMLKQLGGEDLGRTFSAATQLQANAFLQRLQQVLPAKIWQLCVEKCPQQISEQRLAKLITKLSQLLTTTA